jgi:hypothetical protein
LVEDERLALALPLAYEHAIEREDVQVHEGAERRVEALDEGDAPGLSGLDAARLRLALLPPGDLLDEDAVLGGQRLRLPREQAADFGRC